MADLTDRCPESRTAGADFRHFPQQLLLLAAAVSGLWIRSAAGRLT